MKSKRFYLTIVLWANLHNVGASPSFPSSPSSTAFSIDFAGQQASGDARYAAQWIAAHADNQTLPFVIVDKKNARLFVFDAKGRLRGATAVLLGAGLGDESVPGISGRALAGLLPHEQTTPAGRFESEPGHNLAGEDIVWVDYSAKVAIHRLRPDASRKRRAERLASAAAGDKRVSLGCIVVPVSFYLSVIEPMLGVQAGVIYVLPETTSVQGFFEALS